MAAPSDPAPTRAADGDIALEEPDVFYSLVSRMHLLGCAASIVLLLMHRAGVEAIEGWWIVCAPFFPAFLYSRWRYRQALRAKEKRTKRD